MVKCEMSKVLCYMYIKEFVFCRFLICDILEKWTRRKKGEKSNYEFISVWACTNADLVDLSHVNDE